MDIKAIAMGLAFALMWSSAFTSARVIVEYAPPLSALNALAVLTVVSGSKLEVPATVCEGEVLCMMTIPVGLEYSMSIPRLKRV